MTETSQVWDGILTGDASLAPYSASEWADRTKLLKGLGATYPNYGVIAGTGDGTYPALSVQAKSPASTNIEIKIGASLGDGYLYNNDAALTLTVGANASGSARIDTVILRVDYIAQTVRAVIKQGTPAGSPVHPTLQQDATYWEIPLADITVANGFATITAANIFDRRRTIHSLASGWQSFALPLHVGYGLSYGSSVSLTTANASRAIPVFLAGNMLINEIQVQHMTTAITYDVSWGLYVQDTNDGLTAENTLRLVAKGNGAGATAGTQVVTLAATPAPQFLAPGIYWLVLRWNSGTASGLALASANAQTIEGNASLNFPSTIAGDTPQTLDMVTTWTASISIFAARLRGRVFGMTTGL
jgi:hypothetical protein